MAARLSLTQVMSVSAYQRPAAQQEGWGRNGWGKFRKSQTVCHFMLRVEIPLCFLCLRIDTVMGVCVTG